MDRTVSISWGRSPRVVVEQNETPSRAERGNFADEIASLPLVARNDKKEVSQ